MRKQLLLGLVVVAAASACATRSAPVSSLNTKTSAVTYICAEDQQIRREGGAVFAGRDARLPLGWQDRAGDHFVAFPLSATANEAVEYVMPEDPMQNAIERTYDTTGGRAQSDWRLKSQRVCTVKGGYTFALASLSAGKTLDDIARDMGIDRSQAKRVVYTSLMQALSSYHRQVR